MVVNIRKSYRVTKVFNLRKDLTDEQYNLFLENRHSVLEQYCRGYLAVDSIVLKDELAKRIFNTSSQIVGALKLIDSDKRVGEKIGDVK